MSLPYNSDAMGNVFRLQGLKNVNKRKVLPGAEFLQELEPPPTDFSGISLSSDINMPMAETGIELSPQSYDVRANKVIENEPEIPEQPKQNMWNRFGNALSMQARSLGVAQPEVAAPQTPPIETQQVDIQEGLPPVSASQEESVGQWGKLGQYLKNSLAPFNPKSAGEYIKNSFTPSSPEQIQENIKNFPQTNLSANPPILGGEVKSISQSEIDQDLLNRAQANPMEFPVYGATDIFANSPELITNFENETGEQLTPEQISEIGMTEKVMSDIENGNMDDTGYDDQARRLKERILSNQATDMDKYYIGMALLMPLVVGGIFGKEAGLGALGGSASGIANIYGNRESNLRKDEELLSEINKNAGIFNQKNQELLAQGNFLQGKKPITWKNPENGQKETSVEIAPGFVPRPDRITNEKEYSKMVENADKLAEVKSYTEELNDLTSDVVDVLSQMKKQGFWEKALPLTVGFVPGSLAKISQDVIVDGKKVNAGIYLENKLGLLANAYAQAKSIGQLDRAAQNHIEKIITNPSKTLISPKDAVDQMISVRDLAQKGLVRTLKNRGFQPEFVSEEFRKQNKDLFGKLNYKEGVKESSSLLKESK